MRNAWDLGRAAVWHPQFEINVSRRDPHIAIA
jgi:hypothetical protein